MSDDKFPIEENMLAMMTPDNSHLLRRPGTGLSEVAASVCSETFRSFSQQSHDFVNALGVLNKDNDMERDDGEVRQAIHAVDAFVQERKDVLLNLLMNACCFANRAYVGTFNALQLRTVLQNPERWSTHIPENWQLRRRCSAGKRTVTMRKGW